MEAEEKMKILKMIEIENNDNQKNREENEKIVKEYEEKVAFIEAEKDVLISRIRDLLRVNDKHNENIEEENLLKSAE